MKTKPQKLMKIDFRKLQMHNKTKSMLVQLQNEERTTSIVCIISISNNLHSGEMFMDLEMQNPIQTNG